VLTGPCFIICKFSIITLHARSWCRDSNQI